MHTTSKKDLRTHFLALRQEMHCEKKRRLDSIICGILSSLEEIRSIEYILVYAPFRNEIDLLPFFEYIKSVGKYTVFPKCEKNGLMNFYVSDYSELTEQAYGIKEPSDASVPFVDIQNSVCIIPCLSAAKDGNRLGYGGGYYDRFLSSYSGKKIVALYSDFLLEAGELEVNQFDIPAEIIITEEGVIRL